MDTLKYPHINWVTSLWLMCVLCLLLHVFCFLVHIYCIFLLNVGSICAWNPVYYYYYLHLHIHSQILRAGSVNKGEWSRFYLQNKAFMRIIAHMLQLYPFLYLSFKESFLNSKGKLLQKYESFFFFLLNKTRERPSFMYPPANTGFQISLSFFVLVLVAVLRKEERWTLKCQLALTSLQTVLPSLWIQSGPGLSPFSAFLWSLSLQILYLSRGRKKKNPSSLSDLQTHVEYFLLLEVWNSLISISKVNFHTVGILSYMAKCNPHIGNVPAIFHGGKQTVQK